jgi:glycerol-3-phosphate dehydrogenase
VIERAEALQAFESERFDIVVIGGGITGAGVALDAATRGYSVALVEKRDYAIGTSSRSSKLVHGGLRYLQNFDIGLVREALLERSVLVNLAPHLVTPLPLLVPSFEGKRPERVMSLGLNMYDVMARERGAWRRRRKADSDGDGVPDWSPERHRIIEGDEAVRLAPALAERDPSAAFLFYDCQTDDVRLVLTVLGEAERLRDTETGREIELRADNVVNATGVWADTIRPEELHDEAEVPDIRPSRGTHITLDHEQLPIDVGLIVPAGGGRSIFALPWLGRTLVGTTDNDYEGPLDHVKPSVTDVEYLLAACRDFFAVDLSFSDVTGAYAGVRPLISLGDDKKSVDISRRAELFETSSGLVTITGGKLTTWRRMAKMAVDRIVERDGREAPCRTHEIPLGQPIDLEQMPHVDGVEDATYELLARRYGYAARDVLALAQERDDLRRPIVPGQPDLLAEAILAARNEQARSVTDVLLRRTRLGLLDARAVCPEGAEPPRAVAEALGGELGWDDDRIAREVADWHAEAADEGLDVSSLEPAATS